MRTSLSCLMSKAASLAAYSHRGLSKRTLLSQPVPPQVAARKLSLEGSHPNTVLLHLQEMRSDGVVAIDISKYYYLAQMQSS